MGESEEIYVIAMMLVLYVALLIAFTIYIAIYGSIYGPRIMTVKDVSPFALRISPTFEFKSKTGKPQRKVAAQISISTTPRILTTIGYIGRASDVYRAPIREGPKPLLYPSEETYVSRGEANVAPYATSSEMYREYVAPPPMPQTMYTETAYIDKIVEQVYG